MSAFYFCLTHGRVEQGATCRALDRMGPYPSADAAARWQERVEDRDEAWKRDDRRWHGHDAEPD
jgi:hypothetical protein